MGYDGGGNYDRTHNFSADASADIKILAARMDAEFDDFASAMTLPLLRDGQNQPIADIPLGGFKFVNVGAPSSALNYTRVKDNIENVPIYMVDAESSADRISVSAQFFTTASANAAPKDGVGIFVRMGSDKNSVPALYLNTGDGNPYSANVVLQNGSALYSGALISGGTYYLVFASAASAWEVINPTVIPATTGSPGVIEIATTAEVDTGTNTSKAVTPRLLARQFSADAATTTSAGLIEIATTAEASAGTDTSRAVTPAGLNAVVSTLSANLQTRINSADPYLVTLRINNANDPSIVANNTKASAWTFTSAGAAEWRVGHQSAASAHALALSMQLVKHSAPKNYDVVLTSTGVSTFTFITVNASGVTDATSCHIFVIAHQI